MRILFVGHNGYGYPHTRVRCYHFARILQAYPDIETAVLSFRDDLAPHKSEAAMYENLRDREKLVLTGKAVWRLLREKDSIIYMQKAHFHSAAPYLLYRLGLLKRYILDYDDYDIPLSNFFFRGVLNRLFFGTHKWDEITYRIARNACGCVASSRELCTILKKENPHTAYIPTGVDISMFSPADARSEGDEIKVLWNGLIWGEPIVKNLLMLVKAFQKAALRAPRLRLHIVGGGASWDSCKQQISDKYPDAPVCWRDWVDPLEMPQLLQTMDIGVLPLDGDDQWLRCKSPTKLFEYMAAGLPVVSSKVGEACHVIEHLNSGFLAENTAGFEEGLLFLAQDVELRKKMGLAARQRIETEYALPVLGERLRNFLQSLFPESI